MRDPRSELPIMAAMSYFRKGRHRRARHSLTVHDLITRSRRIPIEDMWALQAHLWEHRGPATTRRSAIDYAAHLARLRIGKEDIDEPLSPT